MSNTIADMKKEEYLPSILLYGVAGCGKTCFATTAEKALILDFDDGVSSVLTLNDKHKELRQKTDLVSLREPDPNVPTSWVALEKKLNTLLVMSCKGTLPYKWVILDSLSGACIALKYHVMHCAGNTFDNPKIQHWGTMVLLLEKTMTLLRSLKCGLIVTAHESMQEINQSNVLRPLSITRNHGSDKLMWLFKETWHMESRKGAGGVRKYQISTRGTSTIPAVTRTSLPNTVDVTDKTIQDVIKLMKG
ncbi:MAG: AAA family ATPase [Candidatus Heimdallarchaeota archaeon]